MKCQFVLDVGVDVSALDPESKKLVHFRQVRDGRTGKLKAEPYFPAGTIYEHPDVYHFVNRGMALPADPECEAACPKLTPEQRQKMALEYQADELGIADKDDRELFFAGVIAGYERVNGQTAYLPGPNWQRWKDAQDKIKAQKPADI